MKICIWYRTTDNPWGGGNQFLRALAVELINMGHDVSHHPNAGGEVVLLNAHNAGPNIQLRPNQVAQLRQIGRITGYGRFIPRGWWSRLSRKGPAMVHRLDGVAELIRGLHTRADNIQPAVNRLADYTIFQSTYSQDSFAAYQVRPQHSCIIYNGVDPEIFYPASPRPAPDRVLRLVASSWSPNPRKGFAILAQISQVPGVEVSFAGNWCPSVASAKVVLLGSKSSSELAEILRQADALVHAAENEPCSNAILEALACGLPVLYRNSGGNGELAANYGLPLTDDFEHDISLLRSTLTELREKVRQDRQRFLITAAAQRYLQAFQDALDLRRAS